MVLLTTGSPMRRTERVRLDAPSVGCVEAMTGFALWAFGTRRHRPYPPLSRGADDAGNPLKILT
jgi:hypothetical protein